MRRAFLQLLGMGSLTRGYVIQRPDQGSDPPPSLVPPTQAAGILRARTVIISGTGPNVGLFVYNGLPAKGTLVGAITAPGVTSDPFGNSIPSSGVANFGTWNASGVLTSHFGINNSGDTFLANSAGLTVIRERSSDGSAWFYTTAGQGLGNLAASIAPAAAADPPGNAGQAGIVSYLPGTPSTYVQLINQTLRFATAQSVILPNVTAAATATESHLQIGSGTGPEAGATLAALQLGDSGNNLPGLTVSAPDGNTYDTERLDLILGGVGFTINSTTPQTIFSKHLGLGIYIVEVWAVTSNATAADAAGYAFAFTGTAAAPVLVDFESKTSGTAVVGYGASATLTTQFNGQGTGGNQQVIHRMTVNVSVAGTLTWTGKQLVALNNITVFAGSRIHIRPVVAS